MVVSAATPQAVVVDALVHKTPGRNRATAREARISTSCLCNRCEPRKTTQEAENSRFQKGYGENPRRPNKWVCLNPRGSFRVCPRTRSFKISLQNCDCDEASPIDQEGVAEFVGSSTDWLSTNACFLTLSCPGCIFQPGRPPLT